MAAAALAPSPSSTTDNHGSDLMFKPSWTTW